MGVKKPVGQLGFSKKAILLDAHHHLVGRLASVVAKLLLNGEKVVVVRCEDLNYSGSFFRRRLKYLHFLHKRCNVNPKRGPFHHRSPAKIFKRAVRGMLPIKIKRGKEALRRLETYEGIPYKYMKTTRKIVPEALRVTRINAGRKFCFLGRLSHLVGWKYQDVVASIEAKRKLGGHYYAGKVRRTAEAKEATKDKISKKLKLMEKINLSLESYGY